MDEKRLAGVVLPLFSLRRNNDHGIGDLTALRQWIDWAADAHVGFLQLLPVNALGRDECPSPYSAISSVALEPLYLSLEPWTIPGLEERVFNETGDTLPWEQPSGPDLVDYPKVRFWKMWILRGAWNNFKTKPEYECIMPKFREWVKEQGSWLEDFVCFQILCDLFGTEIWWHWPEQDPARAKAIAADYEEEKDFARWLQWLCEKQWEFIRIYADERNVKLMGDIPIGVSLSSADVFFERHLFDTEWCGGAPAEGSYAEDPFTAKWGQNWGIPLYRWDVMAQDNFAWWRRRVKYCTKIFSMYRIDHILGFYRIYSFPWKPTENGVFLPLSPDQAAQRTGGRLPGFKPRGDDNAADRNMNLADGDLYLRLLLSAAPGVSVVGEDLAAFRTTCARTCGSWISPVSKFPTGKSRRTEPLRLEKNITNAPLRRSERMISKPSCRHGTTATRKSNAPASWACGRTAPQKRRPARNRKTSCARRRTERAF